MSGRQSRSKRTSQGKRRPYVDLVEVEKLPFRVDRRRRHKGLGITIAGGNGSNPYKDDDDGIFIARLTEGGAADDVGLRVDDKIVSINGVACIDLSHYQVANVLKKCESDLKLIIERKVIRKVSVAVPLARNGAPMIRSRSSSHLAHRSQENSHDQRRISTQLPLPVPLPPRRNYSLASFPIPLDSSGVHFHPYCFACNPSVIHLNSSLPAIHPHLHSPPPIPPHSNFPLDNPPQLPDRDYDRDSSDAQINLMTLKLRRDENGLGFIVSTGDQLKRRSKGVYVSAIIEGGSADRDGQLLIGDRILSVNGIDVNDIRHGDVVSLLTRSKPYVHLVVERDSAVDYADTAMSDSEMSDYFLIPRRSRRRRSTTSNQRNSVRSVSPDYYSQPTEVPSSPPSNSNRRRLPHSNPPTLDLPMVPAPTLGPYPEEKIAGLQFPPPPKELGKFRETITKQTLTETVVTRHTSNQKNRLPVITEDVVIHKTIGSRLGLRIAGGIDSSCIPFGTVEKGVFISRVIPNGVAARTERLRIGDQIFRINGKKITNFTHAEVIRSLSDPNPRMILTVRHDPPPEGLQELFIQRNEGDQYGIKIIGGLREHDSYQKDYDSGIFIAKIHRSGVIGRDDRLRVGMRLLEVNGINLIGVTGKEAINAFARAGNFLRLLVCDGWNRSDNLSMSNQEDDHKSQNEEKNVQFSPLPTPTTPRRKKTSLSSTKMAELLTSSKHFPKNSDHSDFKTTTVTLSKHRVDKPQRNLDDHFPSSSD